MNNLKYASILFGAFFLLTACYQASENNSSTRKQTITKTQTTTESIGPDGERLEGEAKTDFKSNEGSFTIRSTAEDIHYKDITTFDNGVQKISESIGPEEIRSEFSYPKHPKQ